MNLGKSEIENRNQKSEIGSRGPRWPILGFQLPVSGSALLFGVSASVLNRKFVKYFAYNQTVVMPAKAGIHGMRQGRTPGHGFPLSRE
jgi:hypothetical protein